MSSRFLVGWSLVVVAGCQASAGAQLEAKSNGSSNVDASMQVTGAKTTPSRSMTPDSTEGLVVPEPSTEAMLGARAGLRLVKPATPTCQCLTVAVGNPSDPAFGWEGPVPTTNPATQTVVGLSSEGLACPGAAKDSRGASYHGYEVVGSDTVIEVETARLGRPIAQGAIVPKPPSGGRILLRSADPNSPYGKALDGRSATCVAQTLP